MKQTDKARNLRSEIKRVNTIIENTDSPYLRRDMEKYLKRLKRELRYGMRKGPRTQQYD